MMFKRLRRHRWHRLEEQPSSYETSSLPSLGTDDRDAARATMSLNELTKSMYEEAREKAKNLEVMTEVAVTLTDLAAHNHPGIQASLEDPGLTEQYDVQFTMRAGNAFYFQKV